MSPDHRPHVAMLAIAMGLSSVSVGCIPVYREPPNRPPCRIYASAPAVAFGVAALNTGVAGYALVEGSGAPVLDGVIVAAALGFGIHAAVLGVRGLDYETCPRRPTSPELESTASRRIRQRVRGGRPPPEREAVPQTPSREDVVQAMAQVRDRVARCASGGVVKVDFAFSSGGSLFEHGLAPGHALRLGEQRCVLDATHGVRMPSFSALAFRVRFPFRLGEPAGDAPEQQP